MMGCPLDLPRLHPGVNDLIRVLGKQAHCSSRTLISCEPTCPKASKSESKYHKNCASPKKGRSWDSLCRPSSLWSPVRPETYYYDCFFYRQYPDRESEYQDIEEKYNAIKQQKLDYSPPDCDEEKIRQAISEPTVASKAKIFDGLGGYEDHSKKTITGKSGGLSTNATGPGTFREKDYSSEDDFSYGTTPSKNALEASKSSSRRNMAAEGSVPCSELAEIRDLLKKSDRETIRKMQEMLALMKELSVRDICRAKCDGSLGVYVPENEQSYMSQGQKKRYPTGDDSRRRNEDEESFEGALDSKKLYRQGEGSPQGSRRSHRQGEPSFQDAKRSYRRGEGSPQGSKRSSRRGDAPRGSSKKDYGYDDQRTRPGDDCDDYGDDDRGDASQRKRGAQDGRQDRAYRPSEPSKKGKRRHRDDGYDSDYDEGYADGYDDAVLGESKQINRSTRKQGSSKFPDDDNESCESSIDEGRVRGRKMDRQSSGKRKGGRRGSGSDTDVTESGSSFSDYSTDGSRHGLKRDESGTEYSGSEEDSRRNLGKPKVGTRGMPSSSSSSTTIQASSSSLSRKGPDYDQDPRTSKLSSTPSKQNAVAFERQGGNVKLPIGKDQLTVHEAVELSNKITDIIVLEIIDDLIRKGLYSPPSSRSEPGPERSGRSTTSRPPSSSSHLKSDTSSKPPPSNRLSRIDESSSRTGPSKSSSRRLDGSTRDSRKEERRGSESRRSSCPRHSRSLSPSGSSRRRSSSCRLEIERERARSAGPHYRKPGSSDKKEQPKPWERRLSSEMKADLERESSLRAKPDRGPSKDASRPLTSISTKVKGELQPAAPSREWSTAPYRSNRDMSESYREPLGSQPRSDRGLGQSSIRESEQLGRGSKSPGSKPSGQSSRQDIADGSYTGSRQYKLPTQDPTDTPGSRRSSKLSQMSNVPGSRRTSKVSQMSKTSSLQIPSSKTRFDLSEQARPTSQGLSIQPTSLTEKEVSGGRVLSFTRTENVDVFVPDSKTLPSVSQSSRNRTPCEPDDLIAATYDTDDSILYYARITPNAFPPVKESYNAAGFMLRSAYDYSIPPRNKVSVKTDLLLQLPRNSYGRIAPRKCLVESYGIDVGADVIDRDYKGNITVVLFNHGDTTFTVQRGNKVAQLICESIHLAKVQEDRALLKK